MIENRVISFAKTAYFKNQIDIIENINDIAPVDKIFENFCKFFRKLLNMIFKSKITSPIAS